MTKNSMSLLIATALMGVNAPAFALPTAVSSQLSLNGKIDPAQLILPLGQTGDSAFAVTGSDLDSQGAATGPLSAGFSISSSNGGSPNRSISLNASGSASFTNSAAGSVTLHHDWQATNVNVGLIEQINSGFSYTFIADGDGQLTLNWDVDSTGNDAFWFAGFFSDQPGPFSSFDPNTTGSVVFDIDVGNTYTLNIVTFYQAMGGIGNSNTQTTGVFDWSMALVAPPTAAPEPASLALLGLGLAGLGLARRRR